MLISALHRLDPERAHRTAIFGLSHGLVGHQARDRWPRLATSIVGLELPNPLGLAAGFDKNAEALPGLAKIGFGWLEVGTITPLPQQGNPKPRLFRLPADRALINRLGFNNDGLEAAKQRLSRRSRSFGIVGANIGANRTSKDPAQDYVTCLVGLYEDADYFTINVSSPNTPGLRDLQGRAKLSQLLERLMTTRSDLERGSSRKPLFLKIAPDLANEDEQDIADVALDLGIDALIIGNTTLDRPGELTDPRQNEIGGLSGVPLFDRSTEQIRRFHRMTGGRLVLIGVGGIDSAARAFAKIKAGASALQLYTGFIYGGAPLIPRILDGLDHQLEAGGFQNLAAAMMH
ncbi:MAG: quinone-dependent dihydroorotate dehydrogenase [Geminicoccaceae bacterium]